MVVDSILPHVKNGPNDHRKDASPFTRARISNEWIPNADFPLIVYLAPKLFLRVGSKAADVKNRKRPMLKQPMLLKAADVA